MVNSPWWNFWHLFIWIVGKASQSLSAFHPHPSAIRFWDSGTGFFSLWHMLMAPSLPSKLSLRATRGLSTTSILNISLTHLSISNQLWDFFWGRTQTFILSGQYAHTTGHSRCTELTSTCLGRIRKKRSSLPMQHDIRGSIGALWDLKCLGALWLRAQRWIAETLKQNTNDSVIIMWTTCWLFSIYLFFNLFSQSGILSFLTSSDEKVACLLLVECSSNCTWGGDGDKLKECSVPVIIMSMTGKIEGKTEGLSF